MFGGEFESIGWGKGRRLADQIGWKMGGEVQAIWRHQWEWWKEGGGGCWKGWVGRDDRKEGAEILMKEWKGGGRYQLEEWGRLDPWMGGVCEEWSYGGGGPGGEKFEWGSTGFSLSSLDKDPQIYGSLSRILSSGQLSSLIERTMVAQSEKSSISPLIERTYRDDGRCFEPCHTEYPAWRETPYLPYNSSGADDEVNESNSLGSYTSLYIYILTKDGWKETTSWTDETEGTNERASPKTRRRTRRKTNKGLEVTRRWTLRLIRTRRRRWRAIHRSSIVINWRLLGVLTPLMPRRPGRRWRIDRMMLPSLARGLTNNCNLSSGSIIYIISS